MMIQRETLNSSLERQLLEIVTPSLRVVYHDTLRYGFAVDADRAQCKGASGDCWRSRVEPKAFVAQGDKEEVPKHIIAQKPSELSGDMELLQESKQEKEVPNLVVDKEYKEEPEAPVEDSERQDPMSFFSPGEATSAKDVCDHYRKVLADYYVSASVEARYIEALEQDDDDDMSILSYQESLDGAPDLDDDVSIFSDIDSVALRRQQIQPAASADEDDMDSLAFDM